MVWITFCQKVFYFSGPVFCRALFPYAYITPSRQWFHENEDTAGSFSDIFGIRLLYVAGAHRQRLQMIIQHLVWLFVHADHRHFRIIWLFVYIEDIFHVHYKIRVFLWRDTPVFIHVGTEFVFLKHGGLSHAQQVPQVPGVPVFPEGAASTGICLPVPVRRQSG